MRASPSTTPCTAALVTCCSPYVPCLRRSWPNFARLGSLSCGPTGTARRTTARTAPSIASMDREASTRREAPLLSSMGTSRTPRTSTSSTTPRAVPPSTSWRRGPRTRPPWSSRACTSPSLPTGTRTAPKSSTRCCAGGASTRWSSSAHGPSRASQRPLSRPPTATVSTWCS